MDETPTAAANDALHLQISIRAAARKHSINHALLIQYVKKAREKFNPGTTFPLKISKLFMASTQVSSLVLIFAKNSCILVA